MKQIFILLVLLLLSGGAVFSQEKPIVDLYAGVNAGNPGDTVCVPIKVKNFNRIVSAQFGMSWNPDAFTFVDLNFNLPNLTNQNFNLLEVEEGNFRLAWNYITADLSGATLEDNTTIFEVCFLLKESSAGQFHSLGFDDRILSTEIIANNPDNELIIIIPDFAPGGIFTNQADNSLQILPAFFFDLECGSYSAAIQAGVTGGTLPYQYSWSGPDVFFSNSATIQNLRKEGIYTLNLTDNDGNAASATIQVDFMGNENGLPIPVFSEALNTPACGENSGSIILSPNSPIADYSYTWSNASEGNEINNLEPGEYLVTVIDNANGCAAVASYELVPGESETEENFNIEIPCSQDTTEIGFLDLDELDDYSFSWSTGSTEAVIRINTTGSYVVTATDGICVKIRNYEVSAQNDAPNADDFEQIQNNLACGDSGAEIGVNYNGALENLVYRWSTGESTALINVNSEGEYVLEVEADNSCVTSFLFKVDREEADFSFNRIVAFLGCSLGRTRIGLDPTDDRSYTYEWSTGASDNTIDVSTAGLYAVTVTETGTNCTAVYTFEEELENPEKGVKNISYDCNVLNNCYVSTTLSVELRGYVAPVTYTLSDGSVSFSDGLNTSFEAYLQSPLELYIEDANGCQDTLTNVISNCALSGELSELNVRQYVVCVENETTGQIDATLYNEVLGNLTVPPYQFIWSNGFIDTSYFRSNQPLDSLNNLFIGVVDALGNQFSRQLSEPVEAYGCGDENSTSFNAADTMLASGTSFTYPLYIENHEGLERAIFTIDWDPCLVEADSIIFYTGNGEVIVDRNIFAGTYETFFIQDGGSTTNEQTLIAEVYFTAQEGVEGVSPFLFSINEVARDADGEIRLVQANHGSISILNENSTVSPGDANLNGIVDHKDLLQIGLGFEAFGPDRRVTQVQREAYAYPWLQNTPISKVDFKHLDCDGNGTINSGDVGAILQNFDLDAAMDDLETIDLGNIPVYLDADTLYSGETQTQRFPIILGNESESVDQLYGIALSLSYDANIIDPLSIALELDAGWIGGADEIISTSQNDPANQILHLAISRKDKQNISGAGPIAYISFRTIADESQEASFNISGVKAIDAQENAIATSPQETLVQVAVSTSTKQIAALSKQVQLYPNPVDEFVIVDAPALNILSYEIYDANGSRYLAGKLNGNRIDLHTLPSGIYWIRMLTNEGLALKKLVK